MGLLQDLMGGGQQRQDYQDFVNRYEQGHPSEGYSGQEVAQRYQQVAPQLPSEDYSQAAQEAFSRLSPEERAQFAQQLQQQASQQNVDIQGLNRANPQDFRDPGALAQVVTNLHQQQPGLLGQLFGGGGGFGGQQGSDPLSSPIARAALAGIAAMAVRRFLGSRVA